MLCDTGVSWTQGRADCPAIFLTEHLGQVWGLAGAEAGHMQGWSWVPWVDSLVEFLICSVQGTESVVVWSDAFVFGRPPCLGPGTCD